MDPVWSEIWILHSPSHAGPQDCENEISQVQGVRNKNPQHSSREPLRSATSFPSTGPSSRTPRVVHSKSSMAARTPPNGSAPAYTDAEGGLVDIHSIRSAPTATPAFISQSAPSYHIDEKKPELAPPNPPNFYSPPEKEKQKEKEPVKAIVTAAPARGPPKKKKVSKWVLWKLWFNTYR